MSNANIAIEELAAAYVQEKSLRKAGLRFGLTPQQVHRALRRAGVTCHEGQRPWTADDDARLLSVYPDYRKRCKLDELASDMGRTKAFICRQARRLGLTAYRDKDPVNAGKWAMMPEGEAWALLEKFMASRLQRKPFCKKFGLGLSGFERTMQRYFPDHWDALMEAKAPRQTMYRLGRSFEYRTRDKLKKHGYFVLRSPQSRSPVDLVAIRSGEVLFVQCKRSGAMAHVEWNEFYTLALSVGATPLLASTPIGTGISFHLLTGKKEAWRRPKQPMEPWEIPQART